MSASKLQKFVEKPFKDIPAKLPWRPVIITSSKGFSLRRNLDLINKFGFDIEFHCKAGARLDSTYGFLSDLLPSLVRKHDKIVLYVWLGTCDLTTKLGPYISITHATQAECSNYVHHWVDKYADLVGLFPSVKLIFLEIPPYSIQVWNEFKGHVNPSSFAVQDGILVEHIDILNSYLREVNSRSGVLSLCLYRDLFVYRRAGRKLNYSLFKDGIHPDTLLARVWMKKLVLKVFFDCV